MTIAEHVIGPIAGKVGVLTLAANTASAAIDLGDYGGRRYFTFLCDAEFYLVMAAKSDAATLPAPVIATTGATVDGTVVDGRCMGPYTAKMPVPVEVYSETRYFRAISVAGGSLRWQPSSPVG